MCSCNIDIQHDKLSKEINFVYYTESVSSLQTDGFSAAFVAETAVDSNVANVSAVTEISASNPDNGKYDMPPELYSILYAVICSIQHFITMTFH